MSSRSLLTTCCLALLGAALLLSPPKLAQSVRGAIADFLRPGLESVRLVRENVPDRFHTIAGEEPEAQSASEPASAALDAEKELNRALQIRLAQLEEKLGIDEQTPSGLSSSTRLVTPSLVEVAVLGDTMTEHWRSGKLIDHGSKNGVHENELVLSPKSGASRLLDVGQQFELSPEDTLLLGRCIIGKVEHVGRWTSTFHLVTDAHYRGRAQLIRKTGTDRYVFEATGILKGQGERLCKLEGVGAEHSVRVHDAVYTADRDGLLPVPLYYGEVVEATLNSDDREWTILVAPVQLPSHLTRVQLLRTSFNPDRLAVKE